MGRTETFFYRFIDRRPWRRLIIAAGLIGYFVISLAFLTVGVLLIPLRWVKAVFADRGRHAAMSRSHDVAAIN